MILMNIKYSHSRELFSDAIEILVASQKDLRHRLYEVSQVICHLQELELPSEFLEDWREIKNILSKVKVHKISGELIIPEKKLNFRNKTGEKIAHKIWNIYNELHFNEKYQ